jgi:hypothetical protein
MFRIAKGRSLFGVPIYLPNDPAIPAKLVPAADHSTRPFERQKHILQREAVGGPPGLAMIAYAVLLAIVTGWLAAVVLGMARMGGGGGGTRGSRRSRSRPAARLVGGAH